MPRKAIYGVALGHGAWQPLSRADVQWACRTDAVTGPPRAAEADVESRDFPRENGED